jgi:5'-3' exonuclease
MIENASQIKEKKIREKIEEHKDSLLLARKLVTLEDNANIDIDLENISISNFDLNFAANQKFMNMLEQYHFTSIITQLEKKSKTSLKKTKTTNVLQIAQHKKDVTNYTSKFQ